MKPFWVLVRALMASDVIELINDFASVGGALGASAPCIGVPELPLPDMVFKTSCGLPLFFF